MKTVILILTLLGSAAVHAQLQVPIHNSYPSAASTIFLDFDGQYITGTVWNWGGPIDAQPAAVTPENITEIFNRVAEDYRIFNINVTTDSNVYNAAPILKRTRVLVTPTHQWYGSAGGVSFVGSFTWGDDTPCWVFSNLLGNNIKYVAEACSHEAGHTLGLQHQSSYNSSCSKTAEYNQGQGSGQIGWAPIMGVGYYRNLTTWYNGQSTEGCNVYQNDIQIVAGADNGFGLRSDDHSDKYKSATDIIAGASFSVSGIINSSTDADVFKLKLSYAQNFKLTAIPQNVGADNSGADVDIQISLLNGNGDTISRYNPSLLLNAGIDTNLIQGTYYIVAEGISNMYLGDYGSVGYYYLNGELNRVLPVERFKLTGSAANGVHALNWSYVTSVDISRFEVQSSDDGSHFDKLVTLTPAQRTMNYTPLSGKRVYYRIKGITADERSYYSNIISLQPGQGKPVQVLNTFVKSTIGLNSTGQFSYQLFTENGQLVQSGKLQPGYNNISLDAAAKGLLLMRFFDGTQYWSEKLVHQ